MKISFRRNSKWVNRFPNRLCTIDEDGKFYIGIKYHAQYLRNNKVVLCGCGASLFLSRNRLRFPKVGNKSYYRWAERGLK